MFNRQMRRQMGISQAMPPGQMLDQLMQNPQIANNPRVQEIMRLRQAGDTEGLQRIGSNICKQNGTSFENYMQTFQNSWNK